MAIILSDSFSGSGQIDGRTPDAGIGMWSSQIGPTASKLLGGMVVHDTNTVDYIDFEVGPHALTGTPDVFEATFLCTPDATSEALAMVRLTTGDGSGDLLAYSVLHSPQAANPSSAIDYGVYSGSESSTSSLNVADPVSGQWYTFRIELSSTSQVLSLNGVVIQSTSYHGSDFVSGKVTLKIANGFALDSVSWSSGVSVFWTQRIGCQET